MYENLFETISIGTLQIKNRGVMPAMVTNFCNVDGSVSDRLVAYHEARAKGGVGLIIVEAAYVNRGGKGFANQIGIDNDALIPGLKKLTAHVHCHGAKIALQLYHGGRQANTQDSGEELVAPSAIPCPVTQTMPHALSVDEIKGIEKQFADAAERAQKGGFDAVELHGAHGYLLNEFLSPNSNRRMDKYGGTLENRRRFPLEIVDAVRLRVGEDFPVIYRISSEEFLTDGLTIVDTSDFCKELVEHGVAAINVSGGSYAAGKIISGTDDILGVYVDNASIIKETIQSKVPVIVANRIKTPEFADDIIGRGKADMVATGRALICDADFYHKAKTGHRDEIRGCLSCRHCMSALMSGICISCSYNPLTGHELDYDLSLPTLTKKKIMVVGGGPGGMEAAYIGAVKEHAVTLYEKTDHLGGNLLAGTKSPYMSEMSEVIEFLSTMLKKNRIPINFNTEVTMEHIRSEAPDLVILAMGSSPIIPKIPGIGYDHVLLAEDVLLGRKVAGKNVVIIGGGSVGVETAELLNAQDKDVVIIEMGKDILADLSPLIKTSLALRISQTRIQILVDQKVLKVRKRSVVMNKERIKNMDSVVVAVGYHSNDRLTKELEKSDIPFTVIGDAVNPRNIFDAVKEGFQATYGL